MTRWLRTAIALAAALGITAAAPLRPLDESAPSPVDVLAAEFVAHRSGAGLGAAMPEPLLTLAEAREDGAWAVSFLRRLHAIAPESLTHNDWVTYAMLEYDAELMRDAVQFFWLNMPITPYASRLRGMRDAFAGLPVKTPDDRIAYLDALQRLAVTMASYEVRLRDQLHRGIVLPADELQIVVPYVRSFEATADANPYAVADARLTGVADADRAAFRADLDAAVHDVVNPAFERVAAFLDGPYREKARPEVGASQYPNGRAYYQYLIRRHTGLTLTPEQIHRIGLEEVARLEAALDQVRRDAGFQGTLEEFRTYLRTDRRFFARSSEEIGDRMMAAIRRIEPRVPEFFPITPKAPYGVRPLDAALAGSMTYGYYQVPGADDPSGYYRFNGSRPEERSTLMAEATIYHELVPGHHFQIALQMENDALDPYRRASFPTAFIEGWGEYASDLAGEMGMYVDPYQRAGRLAMDLFVSTRLVVDTGMNALGWSRAKAIEYMRAHTFETDLQIGTETLRYSADIPAQALAYKLGSRKIHELRERTREAMDGRFDLRAFHAHLLEYGAMPLGVLDGHAACFVHERHKQS